MPLETDDSWLECLSVAQDVWQGIATDPTGGSTSYFDKSLDLHPPTWATDGSQVHVTDLGDFHFYRHA